MAVFLFDLDMTLVDSSSLEKYRSQQLWRHVFRNLHQIRPIPCNCKVPPHKLPARLKRKGHKVGIVTSSTRKYAEQVIDMFKIDHDVLVAYGDTKQHKPHSAPIELAMQQLGARKTDTYYVGDDEIDVQASYRAGITSIGAAWGPFGWRKLSAAPDILAYDTAIILDAANLWERQFIGDFMSPEVKWHRGSILRDPRGGFSLGRYFVASDPRHAETGGLSHAIIDLKNGDDFAEDLGELLGKALLRAGVFDTFSFIVPVPPKPNETRVRYAELLDSTATYLDQYSCSTVVQDGLKCVKDYGSLKTLGYVERQEAVRGAFRSNYLWKNHDIVLIDDVSTTGATAEACTRALYRDGAREVTNVSLAKDQELIVTKVCPECGDDLIIRTNRQNGERFWGCKSYSRDGCTYTESLPR